MFERETRVLIVLPQELVDRGRGFAGRATISLKLPVSLQIVLRALIEEGLKHPADQALLANVGRQAATVRRIRSEARRRPESVIGQDHRGGRPRPRVGGRRPSRRVEK